MRLALAQINCTVGDLEGNAAKICRTAAEAAGNGADVVAFPELSITGYPPEDLVLKSKFVADNKYELQGVVNFSKQIPATTLIVGFIDGGSDIRNAAAVLANGRLLGIYHKVHLPNYGVFDEKRYFLAGKATGGLVFETAGVRLGVSICEDIWFREGPPLLEATCGRADVIININASPFHEGKARQRAELLRVRARETRAFVAYCNLVGGQDELVFDGRSLLVSPDGEVVSAAGFSEDILYADIDAAGLRQERTRDKVWSGLSSEHIAEYGAIKALTAPSSDSPKPDIPRTDRELYPADVEEIYQALLLGVGDYVRKNGFEKVLVGLSGGIDSALVATVASDVIGPKAVECVFMPSGITSPASREDAVQLAANLGAGYRSIPIGPILEAYQSELVESLADDGPDVVVENLQARIRGNLLMALSNGFGWLLLSTGNKSEMSVGYATLYGDMSGGFAMLKDVPKSMVYKLARYRNTQGKPGVIPETILTKEPTAELRAGQKDSDTLPPYDILDPIIECYVERDMGVDEICEATGAGAPMVREVLGMIDRSEYKRRQSPPGVKISPRAFGRDWRVPITNHYRP